MTMTASPRANCRPASVAIGWPKRRLNFNSLIRESFARCSRITASVRSGDGSRQKITSYLSVKVAKISSIRHRNSGTFPSSLYTGTTTDKLKVLVIDFALSRIIYRLLNGHPVLGVVRLHHFLE